MDEKLILDDKIFENSTKAKNIEIKYKDKIKTYARQKAWMMK
jgi:hypothetical protein